MFDAVTTGVLGTSGRGRGVRGGDPPPLGGLFPDGKRPQLVIYLVAGNRPRTGQTGSQLLAHLASITRARGTPVGPSGVGPPLNDSLPMFRKHFTVVLIGEGGSSAAQRSEVSHHRSEQEAQLAADDERDRLGAMYGDGAGHYRVIIERDGALVPHSPHRGP